MIFFLYALYFRQDITAHVPAKIDPAFVQLIDLLVVCIGLKDIGADIFQYHIHIDHAHSTFIAQVAISIQEFLQIAYRLRLLFFFKLCHHTQRYKSNLIG
jgi:hypothetical protein